MRIDDDVNENELEEVDDVSDETKVKGSDDDLGTVTDSASSCQPLGVSQRREVFGEKNDDVPQRRGTGDIAQGTGRIQSNHITMMCRDSVSRSNCAASKRLIP
jgi:hypothetical protein